MRLQGMGSVLGFAGVAGAMFLLTGCDMVDAPNAEQGAICVQEGTNYRLDDDACGDYDDDGHSHNAGVYYLWYPIGNPGYIPPVGQRAVYGVGTTSSYASRTAPKGVAKATGIPKSGGSTSVVQRGGFGIKSGSTGGGGAKAGTAFGGGGKGASSGS